MGVGHGLEENAEGMLPDAASSEPTVRAHHISGVLQWSSIPQTVRDLDATSVSPRILVPFEGLHPNSLPTREEQKIDPIEGRFFVWLNR